ncbi:DegV family protein [Chloroflexota bacterium]
MTVKIVTDSLFDITNDMDLGARITVLPVYVRFREEVYHDNIEINSNGSMSVY